jgi:hypothetical protein
MFGFEFNEHEEIKEINFNNNRINLIELDKYRNPTREEFGWYLESFVDRYPRIVDICQRLLAFHKDKRPDMSKIVEALKT